MALPDSQGCARGHFSRDRGETETETLKPETASRPRHQDRGHIPADSSITLVYEDVLSRIYRGFSVRDRVKWKLSRTI